MASPDLFDTLLRLHGGESLGREYIFVRLARMSVAGHLDYSEISRILQSIRRRADWVPVWMGACDRHRSLAEAALSIGALTSAGDAYLRASLCAHWGSLYALGPAKTEAHQTSLDLYRRGAPWFDPPCEPVEIPFDGDVIPAYLRVPAGGAQPRVVLMIGGADTNKEELHHWGTEFTRRGFAVLPFDGPGQGELAGRYGRLTMRLDDFHRCVFTVIDWVRSNRPELDADRIGIFGNSLGGYLALDSALRIEEVGAVISSGGFHDARSMAVWPDGVIKAFSSCLGIDSESEVKDHVRVHLNLDAVEGANRPPALVVHGDRDDLSGADEARAAAHRMEGTVVVVKDGWHTCTNRDHVVSPLFADWMDQALRGNAIPGFREVTITDEYGYAEILAGQE
jgi:2,6-dihydroxypseudooxynicotine hydrolase